MFFILFLEFWLVSALPAGHTLIPLYGVQVRDIRRRKERTSGKLISYKKRKEKENTSWKARRHQPTSPADRRAGEDGRVGSVVAGTRRLTLRSFSSIDDSRPFQCRQWFVAGVAAPEAR
jgi:hypothetical protein